MNETDKSQKIFCIGFHKTGTKSLAEALRILGYTVTGPNGQNDPDIARNVYQMTENLIGKYDAFQDNPWPLLYKELDKKYPGSKFILTLRKTDKWLNSLLSHFGAQSTPMREWIYGKGKGTPLGNENHYINTYEEHNRSVRDYFHNRPDDLLTIDISEENQWEKLCPFLGKNIPDQPFPHSNPAGNRIEGSGRISFFEKAKSKIALFIAKKPT